MPGVDPRLLVILAASMRPTSTHVAPWLDLGAHQCLIEPQPRTLGTRRSAHVSQRRRLHLAAAELRSRWSTVDAHVSLQLSTTANGSSARLPSCDVAPVVEHRVVDGPTLKDRYGTTTARVSPEGGLFLAWDSRACVAYRVGGHGRGTHEVGRRSFAAVDRDEGELQLRSMSGRSR